MTPDEYAEIVNRLADTHRGRIADVLQRLEERIAAIAGSAPVRQGVLFDLAYALQARNQIRGVLTDEYLVAVQQLIEEYPSLYASQYEMFSELGDFIRVEPEIISALQRQSFQGFEAIAEQQLDVLANGVYRSTLVGESRDVLIKDLRGSINGIYQASDQEEIRRLVAVAQNATGQAREDAIRTLHNRYAADRLGNNMRRYATTYAEDSLSQFSASITARTAEEMGIDTFEYYGDLITDSRQFCRNIINETDHKNEYTKEEIERIWDKESWAGKAPGNPFIVRGGYNCRHHWLPLVEV